MNHGYDFALILNFMNNTFKAFNCFQHDSIKKVGKTSDCIPIGSKCLVFMYRKQRKENWLLLI